MARRRNREHLSYLALALAIAIGLFNAVLTRNIGGERWSARDPLVIGDFNETGLIQTPYGRTLASVSRAVRTSHFSGNDGSVLHSEGGTNYGLGAASALSWGDVERRLPRRCSPSCHPRDPPVA